MADLSVVVISPEKKVWEDQADFVGLPGKEGELGIMPGHIPFISALKPGRIKVSRQDKDYFWDIEGGMAHISQGKITLLVNTARAVSSVG